MMLDQKQCSIVYTCLTFGQDNDWRHQRPEALAVCSDHLLTVSEQATDLKNRRQAPQCRCRRTIEAMMKYFTKVQKHIITNLISD